MESLGFLCVLNDLMLRFMCVFFHQASNLQGPRSAWGAWATSGAWGAWGAWGASSDGSTQGTKTEDVDFESSLQLMNSNCVKKCVEKNYWKEFELIIPSFLTRWDEHAAFS